MKLDPILSLAMNMHASKGVYAVMLGSGVSRSAKIPTGWEVTLELVRRIAKMDNEECGDDPAAWYLKKYGEEADYSKLLDSLATTSDQRQQLLRGFFEPTEEERTDGIKAPTAAHHAIARLVSAGYVKVILTTNFDPLMETALLEAGVRPTVLSTPDAISGATPLMHQRCVVVKLHGDYLDPRIKNTPAELDHYEDAVNELLDRVFDEFGLIVSGWSAEYDTALRRSLERCKTRRFGFYWTSMSEPRGAAEKLIAVRGGTALKVAGADEFFTALADKVSILDDMQGDDPVSIATAVALVKRYLGEPRQTIRLAELISNEAAKAKGELQAEHDSLAKSSGGASEYPKYASSYLAVTKTLRAVLANAAFWGQSHSLTAVTRALIRIAHDPSAVNPQSGVHLNDCFRIVPAMAVLYSTGLGYVATGDLLSAVHLLHQVKVTDRRGTKSHLVQKYHNSIPDIKTITKPVPGYGDKILPFTELLYAELRPDVIDFFDDPAAYDLGYMHWELLIALVTGDLGNDNVSDPERVWTMPGRFGYRGSWPDDPLFYSHDQGDELAWCRQQKVFEDFIAAGFFRADWTRLVNIRRSIALTAPRWNRGF